MNAEIVTQALSEYESVTVFNAHLYSNTKLPEEEHSTKVKR